MIKLIALDMDGTLLTEEKKIPQAHIDAIHQAIQAGVKLVLCTARGCQALLSGAGLGE